jgi:hypothetical protein
VRAAIRERIAAIPGVQSADIFDDARARWLAGLCPCCGHDADVPDVDGQEPEVIGDGVMICGRCIRNRHLDGGVGDALLLAVLP